MGYTESGELYNQDWEGYQLSRQNHPARAELVVDRSTQIFTKPHYTGWHMGVTDGDRNNRRVCKLGKSYGVCKCTECTVLPQYCPVLNDKRL